MGWAQNVSPKCLWMRRDWVLEGDFAALHFTDCSHRWESRYFIVLADSGGKWEEGRGPLYCLPFCQPMKLFPQTSPKVISNEAMANMAVERHLRLHLQPLGIPCIVSVDALKHPSHALGASTTPWALSMVSCRAPSALHLLSGCITIWPNDRAYIEQNPDLYCTPKGIDTQTSENRYHIFPVKLHWHHWASRKPPHSSQP